LEAYGATAGVLGTAFSWYMLSPNWKTIWTGQSQPKSYDLLSETNSQGKPKLRKIAIIMTDGSYNTMRGWKDQDVTTMSANALQLCTNMKAKGIEIYTIEFALDSLPATEISTARTTLQNCGSSIDHFYETLDASQLKNAFAEIGSNVADTQTRLTK
jgi:phage-related tail protein